MVINACNLSCQGCTTFSDIRHSGYVSWLTGREWLEPWLDRLDIKAVGVMGGEPLINPEIREWILGIREMLPQAQIRFVTNGLLLRKHWDILSLLEDVGNTVFKISQHVHNQELEDIIQDVMSWRPWQPVTEYGISRYRSPSGMRFQVVKPQTFLKTFRGDYQDMRPHNSIPTQAFEICVQKRCPMLYQGRVWKCGTLALTPPMLDRMNRPNWLEWQPYLDPGLTPDCTPQELESFVRNFGAPHRLCAQCPSQHDVDSRFDHTQTVVFKKELY